MSWAENPRVVRYRERWTAVDLGVDIADAYSRHRTGRNASLLAYMGLLTVFPLLLGATTVLGLVLEDRPDLQDDLLNSALSKFPIVGPQLTANQGQISGSWWALAIGLGGALWGSMRAFVALQTAFDDIWEIHREQRGNFVVQRLRALIGIGAIGMSQVGSVTLAALVGHAGLPRTSQILLTLGGLALNALVVGTMYRYLTAGPMTWRMVWPGTIMTAIVFTVLQFVGTNLLTAKFKNADVVYGTFASFFLLAFWLSVHGLVALLGAELNAALERRRSGQPITDPVLGDG